MDGKTENRLVLFGDGTYLELIAFIDDAPEKRHGHWWDKPYGVVDFALTTPHALDHEALGDRLAKTGTGIAYTAPQKGGRLTPDGKELKWEVTFPTGVDRGSVPFWCHDITPRERRVPMTAENTRHPCGAVGMGGVTLKVADEQINLPRLTAATAALLDLEGVKDGRFQLGVPHVTPRARAPSIRLGKTNGQGGRDDVRLSLVLQSEKTVSDIIHHIGDGEISVTFERADQ